MDRAIDKNCEKTNDSNSKIKSSKVTFEGFLVLQ